MGSYLTQRVYREPDKHSGNCGCREREGLSDGKGCRRCHKGCCCQSETGSHSPEIVKLKVTGRWSAQPQPELEWPCPLIQSGSQLIRQSAKLNCARPFSGPRSCARGFSPASTNKVEWSVSKLITIIPRYCLGRCQDTYE